jgi:hypothetical protein
MTDPMATAGAGAEIAALQQAPQVQAPPLDAGETRMFANMMQNLPPVPVAVSPPSAFRDAAMAVAVKLGGGQEKTLDELRRGMLESIDLRDPLKTMVVMTDHSMQAHAMFTKLHIATGLAGATTSLFGGLLKNQG